MKKYKDFINENVNTEYVAKYEKWPFGGNNDGVPSWCLYHNGNIVAAISNYNKDKYHVLIKHMESKVKGSGSKLVFMLMDLGVSIETGKANYNSVSTVAYYMNKKITGLIKNSGGKYKSTILGPANNKGKEDYEPYIGVSGKNTKSDNYHYKWELNK